MREIAEVVRRNELGDGILRQRRVPRRRGSGGRYPQLLRRTRMFRLWWLLLPRRCENAPHLLVDVDRRLDPHALRVVVHSHELSRKRRFVSFISFHLDRFRIRVSSCLVVP